MSKLPFAIGQQAMALKNRKGLRRRPRKPSEFRRVYGGPLRVKWQKARCCDFCGAPPPTEMAHIKNGGMGRKANACFTVSACRSCHHELDQGIGKRGMERRHNVDLLEMAKNVDDEYHGLEF